MTKQIVFYNFLSNEGKAQRDWQRVIKQNALLSDSAYEIKEGINILQILKKEAPELVIIAGGDGTINSICQAILQLSKKPKIAILPLGSGNALSYCFGVNTIEKALGVISHPKHTVAVDVMHTNLPEMPIGLFNIGVGFDARIVQSHHRYRYIGIRSYLLSTFRSFMFHADSVITFTIDHSVKLSALASSLMVANGPIIGYNYVVAPESQLNDGLLDCTLFSTKYAYLSNIRLRGFQHPFYSKFGKVHFKASHIKIEGEPYIQVDGDPIEKHDGLEISLLKKQLTFFYNKDGLTDQEAFPFIF